MAMRECQTCRHRFISHGPQGCTLCGCTSVRGGFVSAAGKSPESAVAEMMHLLGMSEPVEDDGRESGEPSRSTESDDDEVAAVTGGHDEPGVGGEASGAT